jgi:hypothetical protein
MARRRAGLGRYLNMRVRRPWRPPMHALVVAVGVLALALAGAVAGACVLH